MRMPGMIRRVDSLGRIVIPFELRRAMDVQGGDELELQWDGQQLLVRKFCPNCIFCGSREDLAVFQEKYICGACLRNLRKV